MLIGIGSWRIPFVCFLVVNTTVSLLACASHLNRTVAGTFFVRSQRTHSHWLGAENRLEPRANQELQVEEQEGEGESKRGRDQDLLAKVGARLADCRRVELANMKANQSIASN